MTTKSPHTIIPASTLRLQLQHPPRKPQWKGITISTSDPVIDKSKLLGSAPEGLLEKHLPNGERIMVSFWEEVAVLEANFKITRGGHIVRPGKEIVIPRMSGKHAIGIGIGNIMYVATVC
ncbi:MAG: hypothetical protein WAV46_01660 [Candidatus Moraniibacteriota bacterium]